ncbi:GT2 family glycosyltransferase [Mucilaginibacter frigoritolerans]|uniref:GT2 family glycosyltransferase n=1 Tax=Mucilaginibacter frigoritolerans TaxID=652788 RepID=A0A562UFU9_9SPHI|nr:glycosyltransferase family 2 protein [Mucilaginibacter frigoritolerans]TWJ04623.1 GT2 family glycosyltransferase [Mucilaginibacter frigoritolerans]
MIFIVIPVFNRKEYTRECIYSLLKQRTTAFKIIVVDHGSVDGTSEMIINEFPSVVLLSGDNSLWWTGATNIGVTEALKLSTSGSDLVLTLNNDLVVNPDYLEQLLLVYEQNKPCLVGSTSVYFDDNERIQFAGISWNSYLAKFKSNPVNNRQYSSIVNQVSYLPTDLLTGRGTLIPISAFKEVGLYDEEKFPHYAADEDFSLSCKRKGYKLLVSVSACVKSHVRDTGINFKHNKLSFRQFFKTLYSIKSANNLSIRYKWAKKNSPIPYFYFLMDVLRIFGSYSRSLLDSRFGKSYN